MGGEGCKFLHWLSIPVCKNGNEMAADTDVDVAGVEISGRWSGLLPRLACVSVWYWMVVRPQVIFDSAHGVLLCDKGSTMHATRENVLNA